MTDAGRVTASSLSTIELAVTGMDCAHCTQTVRKAIIAVPGVVSAEVLLASEKAVVTLDPAAVDRNAIAAAIRATGYACPAPVPAGTAQHPERPVDGDTKASGPAARVPARGADTAHLARAAMTLMGAILGVVLLAAVAGEWLGLFDRITQLVPLWVGALLVLAFGWPVFRAVARNALRGRIVAHTLMSAGALAALAIGQWPTAALVVFFMRVGDYAERLTTRSARRALKDLTALAPQTARLERDGETLEVPIQSVQRDNIVVIRPGETIPVDGEVLSGTATIDQAAITGEAMPVEATTGSHVFAATQAQLGSLRVRARSIGAETTFAKVIRQVEHAEANKGHSQRLGDRFATWYLPIVAVIALATYLLSGNLLAAVAVTVVACSCAFALATPVAMLASIGAAAKGGLLIKGGRTIEALAKADILLLDKTGTVTLGRPDIIAIVAAGELSQRQLLELAASAEHDSEHPLADAIRRSARSRGINAPAPATFLALPGHGVRARVGERTVEVGSRRMLRARRLPAHAQSAAAALEADGRTLLFVTVDGEPAGLLAAADTLRPEVASALRSVRAFGFKHIELLTGDNRASARVIAEQLGISYQAELLPEDKVEAVRRYQARGHTVAMIGDGVNDAPALVQADVGIAMGAAGSDIAIETAHVALMRDDWSTVPELLSIARRTMRVVRLNIGFTAVYNLAGLSFAALGLLPPILAAALQSLPDLGIMGNSARLLRRQPPRASPRHRTTASSAPLGPSRGSS